MVGTIKIIQSIYTKRQMRRPITMVDNFVNINIAMNVCFILKKQYKNTK